MSRRRSGCRSRSRRRGRGAVGAGGAVAHAVLLLGLGLGGVGGLAAVGAAAVLVDDDIGHAAGLALGLGQGVVVGAGLGVLGDDVPRVDEAWDLEMAVMLARRMGAERKPERLGRGPYVAEDAEEDIDKGVGGADAALDPD